MSQFFQRVLNYLANEVIVKSLANSHLFQRFALKVHHQVKDVQRKGTKTIEELSKSESVKKAQEQLQSTYKETSSTLFTGIKDTGSRVSSFTTAFRENLKKEMDALKQQQQQQQQPNNKK